MSLKKLAQNREFPEKVRKNPKFWYQLHLQNPAKFVFGDRIGLILENRQAMSTCRRISTAIHGKLVNCRNEVVRSQNGLDSTRNFHEFLKNVFLSMPEVNILVNDDVLMRILSFEEENLDFSIVEEILNGFRRLSSRNNLKLGEKSVEMLAKRFVEFLKELMTQILNFKNLVITFAMIPIPLDFYRDSIAQKICYFDTKSMLKRLERDEKSANFVLELLNSRSERLIDFVFDSSFQMLFFVDFQQFFMKWMRGFRQRVKAFYSKKNRSLRAIAPGTVFTGDQLPEILLPILKSLFNDGKMTVFADQWADFVLAMIWELSVANRNEKEKMEPENQFFEVLNGNRQLCTTLSYNYQSTNSEEQRTVLAQLLRFVLKFTSDLIRLVFNVNFDENGRIRRIEYLGEFEKVGDGGEVLEVVEKEVKTESKFRPAHKCQIATTPYRDSMPTAIAISSPMESKFRSSKIPSFKENFIKNHEEEEFRLVKQRKHSHLSVGFKEKIRNWNCTMSPMLTTAPIGNDFSNSFAFAYPSPPQTPDSTANFHPNLSFSYAHSSSTSSQAPRSHFSHWTPESTDNLETEDSQAEETVKIIDNNSNEPESEDFEADFPAWVHYNYPIIAIAIDNNDVFSGRRYL